LLAPFRFIGAFPQTHARGVLELVNHLAKLLLALVVTGLDDAEVPAHPGAAAQAVAGGGLLIAEFGFERLIIPARAAGAHEEGAAVAEFGVSGFAVGGLGIRGRNDRQVDGEDLPAIHHERAGLIDGDLSRLGQWLGSPSPAVETKA
jgi:hypothetical protein